MARARGVKDENDPSPGAGDEPDNSGVASPSSP